ncbi:glycosyltransferase family 4 protein [Shewanella frigidimarina]|uniref:glycosyltransferase family 4 protein n=1 Tax=Shewanella frigidimarina TaxID=56812 RepID=UPI003D7AD3F7
MKKKLIILLASNLDPSGGGRETWIANFLNDERIIKRYHSITVIGSDIIKSDKQISFPDNVIVIKDINRPKKYLPGIFYYTLFVKKTLKAIYNPLDSFDVISCGSWGESIAFYFSSYFKKPNINSICWLRSIIIKELARFYPRFLLSACGKLECYMLSKYNICIANGYDTNRYYSNLKVDSVVIANGIHIKDFPINNCKSIQCQYVGRISKEKGVLPLIQAVEIFNRSGYRDDVFFTVIGDGPNFNDMNNLARQFKNVHCKGALCPVEVKYQLPQANISFHLTLSKDIGGGGVSHSLLEAMATGQRIICWDNDIFNQVKGSELFYKAEEGNVQSLIEQMTLAIKDARRFDLEYSKAMNDFSLNYDFSVHVKQFCELVE